MGPGGRKYCKHTGPLQREDRKGLARNLGDSCRGVELRASPDPVLGILVHPVTSALAVSSETHIDQTQRGMACRSHGINDSPSVGWLFPEAL